MKKVHVVSPEEVLVLLLLESLLQLLTVSPPDSVPSDASTPRVSVAFDPAVGVAS